MSAMGFELTQSQFVGPHCLLLEGPSDLIYLDVFSDFAAENCAEPGVGRQVSAPGSVARRSPRPVQRA